MNRLKGKRALVTAAGAGIGRQTAILFAQEGVLTTSEADWDLSFDINVKSMHRTIKAFLPGMLKKGGGSIVNVASGASSVRGIPNRYAYGASKAGQLGFMRVAAMELARYGATVNAVLPGTVLTEGLAANGQAFLNSAAAGIPLGRLGTVDDIANSVMFLASDYASYVTGQTIVVDGGQILPETGDAVGAI